MLLYARDDSSFPAASPRQARVSRVLTRLDIAQASGYYAAGLWTPESPYSLFTAAAERSPQHVAFVERPRQITYGELAEAVDRLAGHLRGNGLTSGDRVAVWLPSRAEVAVTVFACAREGFVCAPSLHRDHTVAQTLELLRRMRAAAFVGQPGYGADADRRDIFARLEELAQPCIGLALEPATAGLPLFPALPAQDGVSPTTGAPADAVVYLAYTSGSTGEPKGVLHSSNTLLAPIR